MGLLVSLVLGIAEKVEEETGGLEAGMAEEVDGQPEQVQVVFSYKTEPLLAVSQRP